MPIEIYEVVAQGARYWFLFLMVLIVWRSYRWYARDRKQRKKRLRLLPDAGFIGEMVVIQGSEQLDKGTALPVPGEGTMGYNRMNDLCVPVSGVARQHCLFSFSNGEGLMVYPCRGRTVTVDDETRKGGRHPMLMAHGSRIFLGEAELRLRLFAGFEAPARVRAAAPEAQRPRPETSGAPQAPVMSPEQFALWQQQQFMMQQQYMQQMAYMQWMAQQGAAREQAAVPSKQTSASPLNKLEASEAADELDAAASLDTAHDPQGYDYAPSARQLDFQTDDDFYPPSMDSDDSPWDYAAYPHPDDELMAEGYAEVDYEPVSALDEDMTDASVPPRSAYLGHDESEVAKKRFWDRYLGGGDLP